MSKNINICSQRDPFGSFGCFTCDVSVFDEFKHLCKCEKQSDKTAIGFTEFLDTLRTYNVCFKVLTNPSIFDKEYANIVILKRIFAENFTSYTTFYEYDDCVGFKIETIPDDVMFHITKRHHPSIQAKTVYLVLQTKCDDIVMCDSCNIGNIINDIQPVLDNLHTNGYVHNDIKYNNVVYCSERFKLIDYGEMRPVASFIYSKPEEVISKENEALQKIPVQIQAIKDYNTRQEKLRQQQQQQQTGRGTRIKIKSKKRKYDRTTYKRINKKSKKFCKTKNRRLTSL